MGGTRSGMPLLAAVVMLSNTQQSLADLNLLWVLIPGALIKPLLILFSISRSSSSRS